MIYIPFIYFSLLLLIQYIRIRTFNLGSLLLVIYMFSSVMSIFLYSVDFLPYNNIEIELSSCFYYCTMLTLFFIPFFSNKRVKTESTIMLNKKLFMVISYFFILINIVAIIFTLNFTFFILTHDPGSFKGDAKMLLQNLGYSIGPFEYIGKTIFGYFSDFYIVILVFYFYSISYLNNTSSFNNLLLLSSMSTIINGIHAGGRTQMIYWVLVFISCYLFFKNQMLTNVKKRIRKVFIILISIFSLYFSIITIFRFSNAYSSIVKYQELYSIIEYSGMSFLKFNEFYTSYNSHNYTLARIFPILYDIFSTSNFDLTKYRQSLPMDIGIFYTFLGDLFVDIGIYGTIFYLLIFHLVFHLTQKNYFINAKYFHQILLLFMLYQIPLNGIFYYSLYNKLATISVIGTVIISFCFKFTKKVIVHE